MLWTGYLVLEGFDFGVGMLLPVLGRGSEREADRRVVINAIGPVWDGNEVWLITAVGAMFAAFPAWYAATLSGFYLPVLLIIVALIGRGVAFEYRGKVDDPRWRARWDAVIVAGSAVPAFMWGLVLANVVRGVQLGPDGVVTSSLLDLLNPYALAGGLALLALCVLHGAVFLALKTDGPVRHRARVVARRTAPAATAAVVAFLLWTLADHGTGWTGSRRGGRHGRAARRGTARRAAPGGLGVHRHRGRGRRGRRGAVRLALPGCAALAHRPRVRPDGRERRLRSVLARRAELGRRRVPAAGAALPGLELLGVPQAGHAGARLMRPLDPRLVRSTRAVRVHLAVTVACGLALTGLILGQAWLVARIVAGAGTLGAGELAGAVAPSPSSHWPGRASPPARRPRRCAAPPG